MESARGLEGHIEDSHERCAGLLSLSICFFFSVSQLPDPPYPPGVWPGSPQSRQGAGNPYFAPEKVTKEDNGNFSNFARNLGWAASFPRKASVMDRTPMLPEFWINLYSGLWKNTHRPRSLLFGTVQSLHPFRVEHSPSGTCENIDH